MAENTPSPAGILDSLRQLVRTGVGVLQNRAELFSVEFEEQKVRLVKALVLAGAAVFLANSAVLALSVTIVVLAGGRGGGGGVIWFVGGFFSAGPLGLFRPL